MDFSLLPSYQTIKEILSYRAKLKPYILIIDEAHTLDIEIANSLLNTVQNIQNANLPLLLMLAGTPDIGDRLRQVSASFWSRCKKFRLGRLSSAEAQEALTVPLQKESFSITFEGGVAECIVQAAYCYPYFIQVWGDHLANQLLQTGEQIITMKTVKQVETGVGNVIAEMYKERYQELKQAKLLPVAEVLAEAFLEQVQIKGKHTEEIVETFLSENPLPISVDDPLDYAMRVFSHTGYIWQVLGGERRNILFYEAGIPSLMSFILENK